MGYTRMNKTGNLILFRHLFRSTAVATLIFIFLSLENITLISTLLFLFFNTDLKKLIENDEAKFFIIFFIISSFVMSIFTFQTGIYWRQKWLLLPYLFLGMSMIQKKNLFNVKK